jgi:hypothetical protein
MVEGMLALTRPSLQLEPLAASDCVSAAFFDCYLHNRGFHPGIFANSQDFR